MMLIVLETIVRDIIIGKVGSATICGSLMQCVQRGIGIPSGKVCRRRSGVLLDQIGITNPAIVSHQRQIAILVMQCGTHLPVVDEALDGA